MYFNLHIIFINKTGSGSNEKIKITPENSYFLLNFFWALGLANKNVILDEGPMTSYGKDQIGNFASTGGWTLGKKEAVLCLMGKKYMKTQYPQQLLTLQVAAMPFRLPSPSTIFVAASSPRRYAPAPGPHPK